MKVRRFLINKEGVWDPDQLNIFSPDDQFLEACFAFEGEAWVPPKLTEVHVESEVLKEEVAKVTTQDSLRARRGRGLQVEHTVIKRGEKKLAAAGLGIALFLLRLELGEVVVVVVFGGLSFAE